MAKKNTETVEPVLEPAKVQYNEAQLYHQAQLKAKADGEAVKRAEVLEAVKKQSEAYKMELRGSWIGYTEKSGTVSPALIVKESFKTVGSDLKMVLGILVFSPETAQPYRAELTY